jgi:hypothetical protein
MITPVYRIEYSIQRADSWDDEFVEIGFGSSGSARDLNTCAYAIESDVTNGQWETSGDMPDPKGERP